MIANNRGFIDVQGGVQVFFHMDSVPVGKVSTDDRVWFTTFPGEPRDRAFPVIPLKAIRKARRKPSTI